MSTKGHGSERNWGRRWWALLAAIVVAGLGSRAVHTGFRLFDKYLGDALYAAMVYVLLRLTGRITRVALWAAVAMTAIELFQLTGVAAGMLGSANPAVRACARLMGTEFNVGDLAAYAAGIGVLAAADSGPAKFDGVIEGRKPGDVDRTG
jgi:hypothetical protein